MPCFNGMSRRIGFYHYCADKCKLRIRKCQAMQILRSPSMRQPLHLIHSK